MPTAEEPARRSTAEIEAMFNRRDVDGEDGAHVIYAAAIEPLDSETFWFYRKVVMVGWDSKKNNWGLHWGHWDFAVRLASLGGGKPAAVITTLNFMDAACGLDPWAAIGETVVSEMCEAEEIVGSCSLRLIVERFSTIPTARISRRSEIRERSSKRRKKKEVIYKRGGCDQDGPNATCSKCGKRQSCGVYWYKIKWKGEVIRESSKQSSLKVARMMEAGTSHQPCQGRGGNP